MTLHKVASLLLCIAVSYATAQTGTRCPAVSGRSETCVCQHQDGIIDITPLANKDSSPKYTDMKDVNQYSYDYNPCFPFTTQGECSNVHVCQKSQTGDVFDIADANTEQMWIDTDGTPYIYYTSFSGDFRQTYVYLECTESSKLSVTTVGDSDPESFLIYKIFMNGCQVCPGGCGAAGGVAAGIVGILLLLFTIIGVAIYFAMGAIVMKVKFNATGTDIIPNKKFWLALPGLIKEGFLFTISPCLKAAGRGGKEGYESVP